MLHPKKFYIGDWERLDLQELQKMDREFAEIEK